MGLANLARIKEQRGMSSQAFVKLFEVQDKVAADVTEAQADVQAAAAGVIHAERELRAALINYDGNVEGLKQTKRFEEVLIQIFRPQEVVFALQPLKTAFDHYFFTVADYNIAQFQLFHALEYQARELSFAQSPGGIVPVNTARPDYLPPVGSGAPPTTR